MTEETKKPGFKINRKIIIFGGVFLILLIISAAFFIFFFGDNEKENEQKQNEVENTEVYKPGPEDFYPDLFKFAEMTIKLQPQFEEELPKNLRIEIYAEVNEESAKFVLMEKKNIVEKYFKAYFGSKKPSEIDDVTEKIIIKQEIFKKIDEISGKKLMKNIYFTEFLILDW
ncbi:MAG: flagellar basal body-associated FliL family protein [Desulforegulaceae bacterium]|nr:flagellar basal body-associated FliL family protein [Desulforegulaceae bacterium]